MDKYLSRFYPEARFGNFTDVNGTLRFYLRVRSLLQPHFSVLDIGCGRGSHAEHLTEFERFFRVFRGQASHVIGVDIDPIGETNPFLDEFRLISEPVWPVESASIDLAVSDWTMEHVSDPDAFLRECSRVLKPGGYLCIRTANRLGYIAVFSGLIPNSLHKRILRRVQPQRNSVDVFPTVYRCNTIRKLRNSLQKHGFDCCVVGHEAEPAYLGFSFFTYALGVLYQRVVPSAFGSTIYAFAKKK